MRTRLLISIASCGLLFWSSAAASAALIAEESFDYPAGATPIDSLNGGTGFFGGYTAGAQGAITAPGLSYPGLLTAGNKFTTAGNNNGAFRGLANAPFGGDSGTIFISVLASAEGVAGPQYAGLSLFNGGSEEFFMGKPFEQGFYGFDQSGGVQVSTAAVTTSPTFLVYELIFGVGDETVNMYVNPTPGQPLGAPTLTSTRDNITFDRIRLQSGTLAEPFNFDEIRFGTTFADVSPVPEPATLVLLLCAAVGLAVVRRRKAAAQVVN